MNQLLCIFQVQLLPAVQLVQLPAGELSSQVWQVLQLCFLSHVGHLNHSSSFFEDFLGKASWVETSE